MIALAGFFSVPSRVQGGGSSEELRTLNTDTITRSSSENVTTVLDPAHSGVESRESIHEPVALVGETDALPDGQDRLEYLVPELEGNLFSVGSGPRSFRNRLSFSPGFGRLGDEPLYLFRVGYNPNEWLGWEAHVGHNRGDSVHALFHFLNAQVRYPVPFRVQPYLSGGFGIVMVFPGNSVNSDPVTENALTGGAGLELYLRDDVAVRGEWRRIGVFGRDPFTQKSTTYSYGEATLGLTFYRRIGS